MKIAMITTNNPVTPREAITKNVFVLSEAFRAAGYEVEIFSLFQSMELYQKLISSRNPFFPLVFQRRASHIIRKQLEIFNPDWVSTHFGLLGTNLMAINQIKKSFPNFAMFAYSYPDGIIESFRLGRLSYFPRIFLNNSQIYRKSLENSYQTIFVSKPLYDRYRRFSKISAPFTMAISENEINVAKHIIKKRLELRQKWGIAENELVLGFLGHPTFVKGIDLVIGSFIKLIKLENLLKEKKLKLFLASSQLGQFSLENMLLKVPSNIRKQISTFSYVSSLEFIGVIDLLIFPLRSHIGTTAIPRTMLEASLVGTPIIIGEVNSTITDFSSKNQGVITIHSNQEVLFETIRGVFEKHERLRESIIDGMDQFVKQHRADWLISELLKSIC